MEGQNLVDTDLTNFAPEAAAAASDTNSDSVLQRKEIPKGEVDYLVVSYKDQRTKQSYVSVVPRHWLDNDKIWFPPTNKSEKPAQVVDKVTWRDYVVRRIYLETVTKSRIEAKSDLDRICKMEGDEAGTSTESDVQQQRQRVKKKTVVSTQPPSAPVINKRVQSKPIQRTAAASTVGKDRKRWRSNSPTETVSECQPLRRSPRKHQVTDISSQKANTSEPKQQTSESTSESHRPMTSPTSSIQNLSSGNVLTSPTAESTPKTSLNSRDSLETKLDSLGATMERMNKNLGASMERMNETLLSLVAAINDMKNKSSLDTSSASAANFSVNSAGSVAVLPKRGENQLTAKQHSILSRIPVVSSDIEQSELNDELEESGREGAFFAVVVRKLADRIMNKSDVKKTANSVLRALYDERYLADRVTMAGYKKCNNTINNRDYGPPGQHYVALGRGMVYLAILEAVKLACLSKATNAEIQKAIRDGVNTLRLHDKEKRMRESRRRECSIQEQVDDEHVDDDDELNDIGQQRQLNWDSDDDVEQD